MEIFNNLWNYLSPIIASFLTYFIAIKGKRKDVDIEKERKLNTVISNLLDVWNYLGKLENLSNLNKSDLPVPFKIMPHIFLNSKSFSDKCFSELENSISLLKEYDPMTYYELSGIGIRFKEIKTNFILPFLNIPNRSEINNRLSETYISETIKEIEDYLLSVSKKSNRSNYKLIRKKIERKKENSIEETKGEIIQSYYDIMMDLIPQNGNRPTLEEFQNELNSEENRKMFDEQIDLLIQVDFNQIMNLVAKNPYISIQEIKDLLGLKKSSNNGS